MVNGDRVLLLQRGRCDGTAGSGPKKFGGRQGQRHWTWTRSSAALLGDRRLLLRVDARRIPWRAGPQATGTCRDEIEFDESHLFGTRRKNEAEQNAKLEVLDLEQELKQLTLGLKKYSQAAFAIAFRFAHDESSCIYSFSYVSRWRPSGSPPLSTRSARRAIDSLSLLLGRGQV